MLTAACIALVPSLASQAQPIVVLAENVAPDMASAVGLLLIIVVVATLPSQFAIAPRLVSAMAAEQATPRLFRAGDSGVSRHAVIVYGFGVLSAALLIDLTHLVVASSAVRQIAYAASCLGLCKIGYLRREYGRIALGSIASMLSVGLLLAGLL